ncbi:MAG TPA: N-acetyl-1-D-myo-inositol-2-amino-2-deoxy-alpha-D-glucopyranoside deacetylase [Actinomycetota bacterium]|jgi:N-acetyl-1-D-myo-inositol-2-amino-2-deoxy-alpha-D-glucopyranoside deacetylase|nr:N-acetyl-1-D-myo-inositol-2-amino-2-deoxy-alpha-D-glucopyranoside deacetylase [Actinomycetota bacterium]
MISGASRERRLVLVHAHPDDEALATGGTIARYSSEGAHVCLVTCTNGELGEVAEVPELGTVDEIQSRLGEVRTQELLDACGILGDVDLRMLGYHDSGMDGTPANNEPHVFMNQDLDEVVQRVVKILEEVRPQVVITYNEFGAYGHPDHIRAHEVALRAVADAQHEVSKVYYTAFPRSLVEMARELWDQIGEGNPDEFMDEEEIQRVTTPDDQITTAIDASKWIDQKFAALEAHRTQRGTTDWILKIPPEFRVMGFGTEHYVLALGRRPGDGAREADLFEGVT